MKILITGGAGFIGTNLASYYANLDNDIYIIDDLSRPGTEHNIKFLKSRFSNINFFQQSVVDEKFLDRFFQQNSVDVVFHMAAQVAVTTSIANPRLDFNCNALGTFNLLEAVRKSDTEPIIIFASTNKVYGDLKNMTVVEKKKRYSFKEIEEGVSEEQNLNFHSPYGCSKGAAEQYMRDYARIYGLKTICFRQSCIYGYHQLGLEDQGWLAWFIIAALKNKEITIFGNGKQVRDVLFITDLISAYNLALKKISQTNGEVYNIGGGIENSISLLEFIEILEIKLKTKIKYKFSPQRPGDQDIFISNNSKLIHHTNWRPKVSYLEGIDLLINWLKANPSYLSYI